MNVIAFVSDSIRRLRLAYGGTGLSQEALAKGIGVTPNTISRWETGTYKPDLEDLDNLARFFGVSILEFFPPQELPADRQVAALLRAAIDLPPDDVEELTRYAEFRRARHLLRKASGGRTGSRKEPAL